MTGIGKSIGVSKSVYSELVSKASCFVRHFSFRVADAAEQKSSGNTRSSTSHLTLKVPMPLLLVLNYLGLRVIVAIGSACRTTLCCSSRTLLPKISST